MSQLEPLDRPSWLTQAAWPWPTSALATPGGRVAVTDAGRGAVLLLAHVGAWSFIWRDLLRELTPHFRCIAVDAPGCGFSDRPAASGTTLTAAAAALVSVLDSLDLRDVTLVAHDLGGPAGFAAAAERADRVRALVAVNTFAWRPAGAVFRSMLAIMGSTAIRETDAALGWLPRATSGRFGVGRHWSAADRHAFVAGIDATARRSWHRYFADARRADSLYAAVEAGLRGPLADRPLLTIFGEWNDPLGFQPRWKALFPDARQEVVPRGNHFPMCDDPALVAAVMRDWHDARIAPLSSY